MKMFLLLFMLISATDRHFLCGRGKCRRQFPTVKHLIPRAEITKKGKAVGISPHIFNYSSVRIISTPKIEVDGSSFIVAKIRSKIVIMPM